MLVAAPGEGSSAGVVPHMDPGRRNRGDRHVDAGVVHEGDHEIGVPGRRLDAADRIAGVIGLLEEEVRQDVMVNIDSAGHGRASEVHIARQMASDPGWARSNSNGRMLNYILPFVKSL